MSAELDTTNTLAELALREADGLDREMTLPTGVEITPVGLRIQPDAAPPVEVLADLTLSLVQKAEGLILRAEACAWAVGDAYSLGRRLYGTTYEDMMAATGLAYQSIANALWLSERFPWEQRRLGLFRTHHEIVAALTAEDAELWLDLAAEQGLSTNELRDAVRAAEDEANGRDPDLERVGRSLDRASDAVCGLPRPAWARVVAERLLLPLLRRGWDVADMRRAVDLAELALEY